MSEKLLHLSWIFIHNWLFHGPPEGSLLERISSGPFRTNALENVDIGCARNLHGLA